ncbi:hypothetical protein Leryth_000884 [Lithospermum erythrorhizon]|nr:hypothetical protein Leryth_000884 [Lithospermum erythrorhizon]
MASPLLPALPERPNKENIKVISLSFLKQGWSMLKKLNSTKLYIIASKGYNRNKEYSVVKTD